MTLIERYALSKLAQEWADHAEYLRKDIEAEGDEDGRSAAEAQAYGICALRLRELIEHDPGSFSG